VATTYKILGQAEPADTSNADIYTVPASTETIVSTLVVANTTGTDTTFKIFIRENGTTAGSENAIAFDTPIGQASQVAFTLGLTLSDGDIITVQSGAGSTLTFSAFGSELS
jgi:hypothetical protein